MDKEQVQLGIDETPGHPGALARSGRNIDRTLQVKQVARPTLDAPGAKERASGTGRQGHSRLDSSKRIPGTLRTMPIPADGSQLAPPEGTEQRVHSRAAGQQGDPQGLAVGHDPHPQKGTQGPVGKSGRANPAGGQRPQAQVATSKMIPQDDRAPAAAKGPLQEGQPGDPHAAGEIFRALASRPEHFQHCARARLKHPPARGFPVRSSLGPKTPRVLLHPPGLGPVQPGRPI